MGADVVVGYVAAFRRAARLRRAARRRSSRPATSIKRTLPGPARRRVGRRRRPHRVPARAADARAAHPPREGDEQHLHRAGAARGHRRACTRRTTAPTACARSRERVHRLDAPRSRRVCARGGVEVVHDDVLRHDHGSGAGPRGRGRRRAPRRGASTSATSTPTRSASRSTRRRRPRPSATVCAAFGVACVRSRSSTHRRRSRSRRAAPHVGVPHASGVHVAPLRAPDAALPAAPRRPRPRARPHDDPARVVHDEAQRDRRDGCRSRGPSSARSIRSRRSTRPQGYLELFDELEALARARSPATTRCRCSRTRARRASTRACSRSASTTSRAASRERDVCLIPASAHGTNAASAAMAGMRVVVVECDDHGNVDLDDLKAKAVEHADQLGGADGHVPVDARRVRGADRRDLRASCTSTAARCTSTAPTSTRSSAWRSPGKFGADVSHLNLHKTFCIPHGGGGPGVGPIGVRAHLAPFLPEPSAAARGGSRATGVGAISAAPWGSAGILPISWAYITMMGADGLLRATQVAILNANYIAQRLAPHYPGALHGRERARRARVHHRPAPDHRTTRASPSTTSPSGSSTTASTRRRCRSRSRAR